jgi:hypothetical protein
MLAVSSGGMMGVLRWMNAIGAGAPMASRRQWRESAGRLRARLL